MYLGLLPLHKRKLRKMDLQPLIDKVSGKLPGCKGKLMDKVGKVRLTQAVLTSIVTHHAMTIPLAKWVIEKIEKY